MTKDIETILEKMKERVATSGKYHKKGLENAPNPLEIALQKLDLMKQRLLQAFENGSVKAGFEKALKEGKWEARIDVAARRWEESAEYMVEEYAKAIEDVLKCVEEAKKAIANMPAVTIEQRAERSKQYQIAMHKCMAKLKGLKV